MRTVTLFSAIVIVAMTAFAANGAGKTIGAYSYDHSGNISSIGPADDGLTNYYDYDSAGRLIRFTRKANLSATPVLEEIYEYDGYGNITKLKRGSAVDDVPVNASTNRLTNATYDAAGNVTTYDGVQYLFDPVGTLTQKSGTWGEAFYIYTAGDERIGIEGPDGTWRYTVRDIDNKVLREWSAQSWNGNLGWVEDYVYREGVLTAAIRPATQGATRHFHVDHLGTPRLITGPQGQQYASHDYFPFGREITDPQQEVIQHSFDTPEPMKFTGHERDFAGSFNAAPVDYMHARFYAPHSGRFLSTDPITDVKKALTDPQTWNRYAYVNNDPLNGTDPDGRLIKIVGTEEQKKQALAMIKENLRPQDQQYVTMDSNGVVSVDPKAKGGLGLDMLRDLARKDVPTVRVSLGATVTKKIGPGPSRSVTEDIQLGGGGATVGNGISMSGDTEVIVDPRGEIKVDQRGALKKGAPASLIMGHELIGHAWDLLFRGKSSERSAVTTETNLLLQRGCSQYRPVPHDQEQ